MNKDTLYNLIIGLCTILFAINIIIYAYVTPMVCNDYFTFYDHKGNAYNLDQIKELFKMWEPYTFDINNSEIIKSPVR